MCSSDLLLLALLLCYLFGCFDSTGKKIELDPLTKREVQKTDEKTTALLGDKKDDNKTLVADDKDKKEKVEKKK